MKRLRIATLWRLPMALLLGAVFLTVVLIAGDLSIHLPMTDGPRMTRQAALLVLPVTLSVLLLPPLPDVHASLARYRLHHWVTRTLFWVVMTAVCAGAWVGNGLAENLVLFEMLSTFSVSAAVLLLVPRFGVRVVLALTILSCAWLLYGVPLGGILGLGDLTVESEPDAPTGTAVGPLLVAVSLAACVVGTLPRLSRHQP
ncbi:MAG: hypothetical protein IPJ61_16600 [Tessaracoccus sp.]|uniref:hypothetical protein n=1 Tax=Tessaracoccus sp. TaxID=1971211 RepID=UPI001EC35E3C|nr:hypothetical protein [Tessaracoccus sp.]MBK7822631.1 hypothetical protein [Tessaracoccus sp.]